MVKHIGNRSRPSSEHETPKTSLVLVGWSIHVDRIKRLNGNILTPARRGPAVEAVIKPLQKLGSRRGNDGSVIESRVQVQRNLVSGHAALVVGIYHHLGEDGDVAQPLHDQDGLLAGGQPPGRHVLHHLERVRGARVRQVDDLLDVQVGDERLHRVVARLRELGQLQALLEGGQDPRRAVVGGDAPEPKDDPSELDQHAPRRGHVGLVGLECQQGHVSDADAGGLGHGTQVHTHGQRIVLHQ